MADTMPASTAQARLRLGWRCLAIVALYAASDEFHQRFVPTREASVVDVFIDTSGAALALIFIWIVGRWRKSA
jgi:VanZ family protein